MTEYKKCTPEEFDTFLSEYPNKLSRDVSSIGAPPIMNYWDPLLGEYPKSRVAGCYVDDYLAEEGSYRIVEGFGREYKQSGWHIRSDLPSSNTVGSDPTDPDGF